MLLRWFLIMILFHSTSSRNFILSFEIIIILLYFPFIAVWDWLILLLVMYTAICTPYVAAFLLNEPDYQTNKPKSYSEDPLAVVDFIGELKFYSFIISQHFHHV